jgi:Xaa-Pro aminopeptidase
MPQAVALPTTMDHKGRVKRLQGSLDEAEIDFLLITHLANIRYLTGFTGSSAVVLVDEQRCIIFTDGRYRSQAQEEVKGPKIMIASKSPLIAAAEWLQRSPAARAPRSKGKSFLSVGIESESMSAAALDRVAAQLKGKARLRSAPQFIERARMVKDAAEIGRIRQAVELGASLFKVALKKIRPGVPEVEVAGAMEYAARCAGADGMSFPTILASGTRSAIIHGRASQARIPARGFVVCDFGVILAGYCSDRTRTFHVGKPAADARYLYYAVLEAQQAAIEAVRPGATAADVDAAARSVLKRRKLDRYFTHSTGHGLGLEIHEAPRLALGQAQKLESGMVITIEPGAYIPGKWGVRIEDVVLVTSTGCEVLTPTDKELVVI